MVSHYNKLGIGPKIKYNNSVIYWFILPQKGQFTGTKRTGTLQGQKGQVLYRDKNRTCILQGQKRRGQGINF